MSYSNQLETKIRTYLSSLSPKAVKALVRNLEKTGAQSNAEPHIELVLAAALTLLRKPQPTVSEMQGGAHRRSQIQRMFFSPLEDFLISETLHNRQEGRINRVVLDRVWGWLSRDVMAADVHAVLDQAGNVAVSGERIDALVQALRTRSVDAIGLALQRSEVSEKERRRMGIELGGERGIAELIDIHKIFAAERWLMPFLQNIPGSVDEHCLKKDKNLLRLVDKCSSRFPGHVPFVAAALIDRSETPSALCGFAGRLAGDSDPGVIANSQFAPFVDVVVSEAERLQILALDHRNNNPDPVAFSQALGEYHSLVRGVERDLDISVASKWHKQLSETKRNISVEVTRELNNAHGAIRRALQVPKIDKDGRLETNQKVTDEAVRTLRVVMMARNASETFAVNDVAKRTRQAVEQTLEIVTRSLIADLGKAKGKQLKAHVSAVDTSIMLSEIYFGTDYAAQLRRSRHSAVTKARNAAESTRPSAEHRLVKSALAHR